MKYIFFFRKNTYNFLNFVIINYVSLSLSYTQLHGYFNVISPTRKILLLALFVTHSIALWIWCWHFHEIHSGLVWYGVV